MSHPSPSELVNLAAGEADDSARWRHVRACSRCLAEVSALRDALGSLQAEAGASVLRTADCLDDISVASLIEATLLPEAQDRAVEHLAECAACRSAVASVRLALGTEPVAAEMRTLEPGSGGRGRIRRYLLPVAVAASALLVVTLERPSDSDQAIHRERPVTTTAAPRTISPVGTIGVDRVLRWHSVEGVDRYHVTLFDEEATVLQEAVVTDTAIAISDAVALDVGRRYFWMVRARTAPDRWVASEMVEFSIRPSSSR